MSADTSAVLIFGLHYDLIPKDAPYLENDPEDYGLQYVSPYYDSPRSDWVYGVRLCRVEEGSTIINAGNLGAAIGRVEVKFKELTGLDGKLYLSTHAM